MTDKMRRSSIWLVSTLLALALAAQAVRLRIAESAVRNGDALTGIRARPQNGSARALLAERLLARGRTIEAREAASESIRRTPLTATGLRVLAMADQKLGHGAQSEGAWQAASLTGWRDPQTQLWAMLRGLGNRQPGIFAARADALLRTNSSAQAAAIVRRLLISAPVRHALVERMRVDPPWRPTLFHWDGQLARPDLDGMKATLYDLGNSGFALRSEDLNDTIRDLLNQARYQEAIDLDRRFVRRLPDRGSVMDDGGFARPADDYRRRVTPFDWAFTNDEGTVDESGGDHSLVATASNEVGRVIIQKYVALRPGAYVLRYEQWGDPAAATALGAKIICNVYGRELGSSEPRPLASREETRKIALTIGPDCPTIRLMLGQFWPGGGHLQFDNFKLDPAP